MSFKWSYLFNPAGALIDNAVGARNSMKETDAKIKLDEKMLELQKLQMENDLKLAEMNHKHEERLAKIQGPTSKESVNSLRDFSQSRAYQHQQWGGGAPTNNPWQF
ncbi:MAG: hypothetical protein U0003_04175 [Vampirovibrionales bacterium]